MNRFKSLPLLCFALLSALAGHGQTTSSSGTAHFQFREPQLKGYLVATNRPLALASQGTNDWLTAQPLNGSTNTVQLGSRIALEVKPGTDVTALLAKRPLKIARRITPALFILQANDALSAAQQAQELAALPGIESCAPVMIRHRTLHSPYASAPNDPYFNNQWHLENRDANGKPIGADVNIRSAWPITHGEGIIVGVGDEGIELTHPDLAARVQDAPHFNFVNGTTNGNPMSDGNVHATAVAGLISAESNNGVGIAGLASGATLASWVIFGPNNSSATDEQFGDMFQYQSNVVSVQNHSWGNGDTAVFDASTMEKVGISNAVAYGRNGKGVIMVRAGGNNRSFQGNANDDGYLTMPVAIPVAAARVDGRVASYSSPGANLLVAAPSGDSGANLPTLFTTDRQGALGYNQVSFSNDLANYGFGSTGFSGTSGSAPQIAGIAALLLSVNPNLTYRDVQQILLFSARHYDFADPDLTTNGAGFRVTHNVGFGVPDAGVAVRLAQSWSNRPPVTSVSYSSSTTQAIPEQSLYLYLSGSGVTPGTKIQVLPDDLGPRADKPTLSLPIVYVGQANSTITQDLHGKAALIQRGGDTFVNKIQRAATAGAAFAIIFDNTTESPITMAVDDFSPIPGVFMRQSDGQSLTNLLANNTGIQGQLQLMAATYAFNVTDTLSCEHVALTMTTDHPVRGDLRITLTSPSGVVSILQRQNEDLNPGPVGWTYLTTHHFYESSYGTWTVQVSDEVTPDTGNVQQVALKIYGVIITDTDHDGLDDNWEMANFGTLAYSAKDDPDGDGYNNAREQVLGTNPNAVDAPFKLDISRWNPNLSRVSWPGRTNRTYQVYESDIVTGSYTLFTNISGAFPETEWFTPQTNLLQRFFQIREIAP